MKLKKIFIYSLLASAFVACDNIDENDRISKEPVKFEASKNILIEDFTGQKCINCPNASNVIHNLQNIYGASQVIAVAIHGGGLSVMAPSGLATESGNAYVSHWNVDAFPKGMVDRTGGLSDFPSWPASAVVRLQLTTPIQISIENNYNESTRELNVQATVNSKEDYNGKLQLWLIEDHIIGRQSMPDGSTNKQYEHNHVFRTEINGLWGEDIQLSADKSKKVEHTITLDEKWTAANVSVVAFVYDDAGVQQTNLENILPKQQ